MNTTRRLSLVPCALVAGAALFACTPEPAKPLPPPPAAKISSFTATPTSVAKPGDMVTLSWATTDATSVSIDQVGAGAITASGVSGTATVTVDRDTIFVLTARGEGGSDARSVGVSVGSAASGLIFAALPSKLEAGESTTLTWYAPGAQAVTLEEVGGAMINIGAQKENGSVTVAPAKSTSYKLTADGRQATQAVTVSPVIDSFALDGAAPAPGAMAKITWRTRGATALTLKREGVSMPLVTEMDAAKVATGDFTDTVPASLPVDGTVRYTLEVTAGTTTISRELVVRLAGALRITAFNVPPYARPNSEQPVSWQVVGADALEVQVDGATQFVAGSQAEATTFTIPVRVATSNVRVKLVVRNNRGSRLEQEKVIEPVRTVSIATFTVTPGTVATGGAPVTLTWNAPNARRVRVIEDGLLTVAAADDMAAVMGTATAYPNGPRTTYTLLADNTIDPTLTATADAVVTSPIAFAPADGGTVVTTQGQIDLTWPTVMGAAQAEDGGQALVGFPTGFEETPMSTGFDDISTTGTELVMSGTDNGRGTFTPGNFDMVLIGRRVASVVTVSTNGVMAFAPALTAAGGDSPPAASSWPSLTYEANIIAPFWADLDLVTTGRIYWQVKGTRPNQVLIVQWDKAKQWSQPTSDLTFQAKVYQSGQIDFEYKTMTLSTAPTNLCGMTGPRGIGLATNVLPTSGLRRTLFGTRPYIANFNSSQATILRNVGFQKIGTSGLMAIDFTNFARADEIAISEVMYRPDPTATAGEWFEVVNRSPVPLDLSGWTIDVGGLPDAGPDAGLNLHTIAGPLVVPP